MKKKIILSILYCSLFSQILSVPKFFFENKFFITNKKNIITSISSSENNNTFLFMKKDSDNYIELHKDEKNPDLFVFDLKTPGDYKFKYKKENEENELLEKIKVFESFDKFIKLTNKNDTNCFYLKDILSFEIESENKDIQTSELNDINIYLYQPKNEMKFRTIFIEIHKIFK